MQIRNFGKKSLTEVKEKLATLGMTLKGAAEGESYDDSDDDDSDDDAADEGADDEA
jgi:hypothetical protein